MSTPTLLPRPELAALQAATLAADLAALVRRPLLLATLPLDLLATLPAHTTPGDQLWSDLNHLNRLPRAPGVDGPPLAVWLDNAALLAAGLPEAATFAASAARARAIAPTLPGPPASAAPRPEAPPPSSPPPAIISAVGAAHHGSVGVIHGPVVIHNTLAPAPPAADPPTAPAPPIAPRLAPPPATPITWRPPPPPPPPRPETPFPLLDPIEDPAALGGRDDELDLLLDRVARHRGLMGLYAPSGQGKSSLLIAGLIPRLRAEGIPAILHRRPDTPGLARALIDGLITAPPVPALPDDDPGAFAAWIDHLAAQGPPPVIVLDQFEAIFKSDDLAARARVGLLLAATVDPGRVRAPRVRWILAYREEFHGSLQRWLGDVLQGTAPEWHARLPHDLAPDDTLAARPIAPLGATDAIEAFTDAITRPLTAAPDRWRFADDGINRLAEAFAAARARRPDAPLVPELQVVLNRLVLAAPEGTLTVPEDIGRFIDDALRDHVIEALHRAFTHHPDPVVARTMALLALRRLADAEGRRAEAGLPRAALRGLADEAILDALAAWNTRLLVPRGEGAHATVTLSHDRLAEVLLSVDDAEVFGPQAGFDARLIGLARLVGQRAAQYADTGDDGMLSVGRGDYRATGEHPELLWDDDRRRWWQAVVERRRLRRRNAMLGTLAVLVLGALALWRIGEVRRQDRIAEALASVQSSQSPEAILRGVQALLDVDADPATIDAAIDAAPLTAAEATPDEPIEPARVRFIRRRLAGGNPAKTAEDFGRLIAGVEAGAHPEAPGRLSAEQRRRLRADIRAALLARFPAEREAGAARLWGLLGDNDPQGRPIEWVTVEGGSFDIGDERGEKTDELPVHRVTLPGFELSRAEVTIGQYRAFDAEGYAGNLRGQQIVANITARWGDDAVDRPAWMVNWHEAWAFALWADPEGRLPTEAEWEFATRGGVHAPTTATLYWSGGDEADLAAVGWYDANSGGLPRPVCSPPKDEPRHPLGLCDVHGNLYEWVADWHTNTYPDGPATAPAGPRRGALRVIRGGCFRHGAVDARSANRLGSPPGIRNPARGFRLARSAPSSEL